MRAHLHERAVAAAARRGLLTRRDLAGLGISPDAAEDAVRAGQWRRPIHGCYVPHARPSTPAELAREGAAYVGSDCTVTGLAVLQELGSPWLPEITESHLLVRPEVRRASRGSYVVQRTPHWREEPTWSAHGMRYAAPHRAVVDAARDNAPRRARHRPRRHRPRAGNGRPFGHRARDDPSQRLGLARRAIEDAVRGCASPPEAELVEELIALRRPFLVNPEIWLDGALLGITDVWIVGTAVGGEVESRERHEGNGQEESTYDRHERFSAAGVELVHLSVARIRREGRAAARYLLQRAAAGPPVPRGLVVVPRGPLLGGR